MEDFIIDYFADIFWEDIAEMEIEGDTPEEKDEYIRETLYLNIDTYAESIDWDDIECSCDDIGETLVQIAKDFCFDCSYYEKVLTDVRYRKCVIIEYFFNDICNRAIERYERNYELEDEEYEENEE